VLTLLADSTGLILDVIDDGNGMGTSDRRSGLDNLPRRGKPRRDTHYRFRTISAGLGRGKEPPAMEDAAAAARMAPCRVLSRAGNQMTVNAVDVRPGPAQSGGALPVVVGAQQEARRAQPGTGRR
jgi:hypothetical protein